MDPEGFNPKYAIIYVAPNKRYTQKNTNKQKKINPRSHDAMLERSVHLAIDPGWVQRSQDRCVVMSIIVLVY